MLTYLYSVRISDDVGVFLSFNQRRAVLKHNRALCIGIIWIWNEKEFSQKHLKWAHLCILCRLDATHYIQNTNIITQITMLAEYIHPKSRLCPLQDISSTFSLILVKSLQQGHGQWCHGWRMHHVSSHSLSFSCRAGLFLTWPGSKMACQWVPRLLIHIYFEAAGVTGQKEKHMLMCSWTHTDSSGVRYRETRESLYESRRTTESLHTAESDLSNLTMIHFCKLIQLQSRLYEPLTTEDGVELDSRWVSVADESRAVV